MQLTASRKLHLLVFILSMVIIGIGAYGISEIKRMNQETGTLYRDRVEPLQQLDIVRHAYAFDIRSAVEKAKNGQSTYRAASQHVQKAEENIRDTWNVYLQTYLTPEEKKLADEVAVLMQRSDRPLSNLKQLLDQQNGNGLETVDRDELAPLLTLLDNKLTALIDLQVRISRQIYAKSNDIYDRAAIRFVLVILGSLVFAIIFSHYLVRNVRKLIKHLHESNISISRAQEKHLTLINNAGDAIFLLDYQLRIEEVNHSACKLLGYTVQELLAMRLSDLVSEDEREAMLQKAALISQMGGSLHERSFRKKDGTTLITEANVRVLPGEGYIAVIRDLTERRQTQLALMKLEEKYHLLIDHAADVIVIADIDGIIVDVNRRTTEMLGYSKEELIGKSALLLHPPEVQPSIPDLWDTLKRNKSLVDERVFRRKDGTHVEVEVSRQMLPDGSGAIAIVRDITERKKAEQLIIQSEANYRHLFDMSPAPMWVIDRATSKILQANKAFTESYGYSNTELAGMSIEDIQVVRKPMGIADAGQRHRKKSGETIDVITSSIPIVLNGQEDILMVAVDVTEKNLYEQKLAKAAIKAQEDERYEIGGELHDNVCQILATALMYLGIMKKNLQPEAESHFNLSKECIQQASNEIRGLSHRLAPAFFNDSTLEDAFRHLLNTANTERKYKIELYFDQEVTAFPLARDIQLNLYRILQEQLRNIVKHAKATVISVSVTIDPQQVLRMRIADNGVGFDNIHGRDGIGLANMNRRAQLFFGSMVINTHPGEGCELLIDLPLAVTV